MKTKILVNIPISTYSGYGRDGIGLCQALMRAGFDVYLDPENMQAPVPEDVLSLMSKEPKAPFDIIIQHIDPMNLTARPAHRRSTEMLIGWTMWEWNSLSNAKNRSKFRDRWKDFDALIAYDQNTKDAMSEYYDGPIIILQGGFDPEPWQPIKRDWHENPFRFIQIGMLSERKNPWASISAFQRARELDPEFREHARLALKTGAPGLHSKMEDLFVDVDSDGVERPKLRIFYDTWPNELVQQFYASAHVLLAPSRGEGKNLPALEFLATGGTVIATNWGGHLGWLSDDYAYALDYKLEADNFDFPKALSATASVEHLADLMLHTFHNRAEAQQKGYMGSKQIPHMASWDSVVVKLMEKIAVLPNGEKAVEKYAWHDKEIS